MWCIVWEHTYVICVLGGETGTNSDELVIAITLGVGSQTTP